MKHVLSHLFLTPLCADIVIESMKHDVVQIHSKDYNKVIGKFRDNSVASVLFFREKDDANILEEYNKAAKSLKGMAKVAAINCDDGTNLKFCKAEGKDADTPFVVIYPVNPQPSYVLPITDVGKVHKRLIKSIPDHSKVITAAIHDEWITTSPSQPKILLFSDKPAAPAIFKALSSETVFRRSLNFGFVPKTEESLAAKYKITKFPAFLQVRGSKAEILEHYKGEMNFPDLHAWCNLYSESGMGDTVHAASGKGASQSAEEQRPWLVQDVPELTAKSHQDICFKGGDGLCVIYATDKHITEAEISMIKTVKQNPNYNSQIADRGTKFKWMWINLSEEKNYKELLELPEIPGVVVFNPHKRLRFTKLEDGKAEPNSIMKLLDKILGGDARFKPVKGQKLPAWAIREEPKDKAAKEEL